MALDAWTREPHELRWRAREKAYKAKKGKSAGTKLKEAVRDKLEGTRRCACGCGEQGTAFRGGQMYNPKCVGKGSRWKLPELPEDRTPPLSSKRKRDLRRWGHEEWS